MAIVQLTLVGFLNTRRTNSCNRMWLVGVRPCFNLSLNTPIKSVPWGTSERRSSNLKRYFPNFYSCHLFHWSQWKHPHQQWSCEICFFYLITLYRRNISCRMMIPQSQSLPPDTSHLSWVFLQKFLSQQPVVKHWEVGTKTFRKVMVLLFPPLN